MRVIVKEPRKKGRVVEIPQADDCSEYKKLIGCDTIGGITLPAPIYDVYMLCDGNSRFNGSEYNFYLPFYDNGVFGTVVFVGIGEVKTTMPDGEVIVEHDFISLEQKYIDYLFNSTAYLLGTSD